MAELSVLFRRTASIAALATSATLLVGCGDDEKVGAKPEQPSETPALWNPCDALDTAFISAQFGSTTTKNAGSPHSPECRFTPEKDSGEAVVTANYLLFPGTLEQAWKTMGQPEEADVRTPRIEGADDARIVVDATEEQLYVTGFVQTGDLIQQVDLVDPSPYAEKKAVRGVEAALAVLAAHAGKSGAGAGPSAPTSPAAPSSPSSGASVSPQD